jgi:PPOX class probable F420-dependent enzyme
MAHESVASNQETFTMLDFTSPIGRRIKRRLRDEHIIWLTTVDVHDTPQPRPVWFHWDGETLLIFSQTHAAKVRHIQRQPRVALNFNTDAHGDDVGVLIGEAVIVAEPIAPNRLKAYLRKYRQDIKDIGMTVASFQAEYCVAILVTPVKLRGM